MLPVHPFAFEHAEEPFGGGIVSAVAHRTHAANDLMWLQESLVFGGKVTAAIRVQNDWREAAAITP